MEDKYIVLTHSMIRRKDMTMQEKIFYIEILNLSSLERGCIASNGHFEKSFGVSKKSASNTIASLVKKGFIISEITNRNHLRILSIKDGQVYTKDGQVSIKSGESKENITINKTINKTINIKNKQKETSTPKKTLDIELIENHTYKDQVLEFVEHRKDIKKPFTQLAFKKFVNLVDDSVTKNYDVAEMIDKSITAGYSTIYPPKANNQKNYTKYETREEKNARLIDEAFNIGTGNNTYVIDGEIL